jgi:hypothetical protein
VIKYFVLINDHEGNITYPLLDVPRPVLRLFPDMMSATKAAEESNVGRIYGYQVLAFSQSPKPEAST